MSSEASLFAHTHSAAAAEAKAKAASAFTRRWLGIISSIVVCFATIVFACVSFDYNLKAFNLKDYIVVLLFCGPLLWLSWGWQNPTATDSPIDYAKSIALSARRRDDAAMNAVFERHRGVDGGLSKAAFISALKEVQAPVLFSSDNASVDTLFGRADTNASGSVDLSEHAPLNPPHPPTPPPPPPPSLFATCQALAVTPSLAGLRSRPICPTTLKCYSKTTG